MLNKEEFLEEYLERYCDAEAADYSGFKAMINEIYDRMMDSFLDAINEVKTNV